MARSPVRTPSTSACRASPYRTLTARPGQLRWPMPAWCRPVRDERSSRSWPAPPPARSRFPELNVRTCAGYAGKPGVYFLSPEAADLPAVRARRTLFHLPGYPATMTPVESKRTSPMVRDAIPGAPSSAAVAAPPPRRGCATGEPRRFFGLCVTACARSVGVACMARTFTTCRGRSKTPRSGSKPIRLQPPLNWRCRTRLPRCALRGAPMS